VGPFNLFALLSLLGCGRLTDNNQITPTRPTCCARLLFLAVSRLAVDRLGARVDVLKEEAQADKHEMAPPGNMTYAFTTSYILLTADSPSCPRSQKSTNVDAISLVPQHNLSHLSHKFRVVPFTLPTQPAIRHSSCATAAKSMARNFRITREARK
jgi:hypothetical protein